MVDPAMVLREALALDQQGRAVVPAELLASLDELAPDDAERLQVAWAEEIERRARLAASASEDGEDWSMIRRRLLGEPQV